MAILEILIRKVVAARRVVRVVGDHRSIDRRVGNDDADVGSGIQLRREDPDLEDRAFLTGHLDKVPYFEGSEGQEHEAGCEVGERPLHRENEAETASAEHGDERRRLDSEETKHRDQDHEHRAPVDEIDGKALQRLVELGPLNEPLHTSLDSPRDHPADDECRERADDVRSVVESQLLGLLQ